MSAPRFKASTHVQILEVHPPDARVSLDNPRGAGSSLGAPWAMKIERILCQVLRVPSVEKKTASSQDVVIVRVITDGGLEGIGEADASPEVVKAIVDAPFSHNIASGLREI